MTEVAETCWKNSIGSILVTTDFTALHRATVHRITTEERQNVGATMRATLLSILLTAAGPAVAAHQTCLAFSDGDGWKDFTPCTRTDASGRLTVPPHRLRSLKFDKYGLATVWTKGFYYVRRDGRMARVLLFDNGADYFVEGLARTEAGGKIGFIDRKLRIVIPPRYDFAFPFNGGTAEVCNGCKETSDDGEHKSMVGGQWGIIDRHGREVASVRDRWGTNNPDRAAIATH